MTAATRQRLLPGRQGEAVRDLDKFARRLVRLELIEFTEIYSEPMTLKISPAPKALMLAGVEEVALPETPIDALAPISITAISGGLRINMIFGLEVGTRYRFVMLAVGE